MNYLDRLGQDIGYSRDGRSDSEYREHLNHMLCDLPRAGTVGAIHAAVTAMVPHALEVTVASRPGHVIVGLRLRWWRRALIFPARRDRRNAEAALQDQVAAGVIWEVVVRGQAG